MVGVVIGVVWVGQAWLTGHVAARHGLDRRAWVGLGLVFPLAALVTVQLRSTRPPPGRVRSDVAESLRRSRVARRLADEPGLTIDEVAQREALDPAQVKAELGSLRLLGMATHTRRRWRLREAATEVFRDDVVE